MRRQRRPSHPAQTLRVVADLRARRATARPGFTRSRSSNPNFLGIRRVILESRLRYIFTRFGVPYFVSIASSTDPEARAGFRAGRRVGRAPLHEGAQHRRRRAARRTGEGRAGRDRAAGCGVSRLHLYCTRRHPARHRHARAKRNAGHDGLFQNSFSDGACSGLHQLAIVHELGQLRSDRPHRARRTWQGRRLSLPR